MNRKAQFANLVIIATIGISAATAQTTNTFEPVGGSTDWHTEANWSEGHSPTFAEDAVIPTNETCIISGADGVANTVEVESGATLGVEDGHSLTVDGADIHGELNSVRVVGTLYFKEDAQQNPAELLFNPSVSGLIYTISGGGTVTAASASGYGAGRIAKAVVQGITLQIASGATVKGELEFDSLVIDNDGLILVDGSDTLTIGASSVFPGVRGSGTYKVNGANASMTITHVQVQNGNYEVIDGTLDFANLFFFPLLINRNITVDGGTLTSDGDFRLIDSDVTIDNDGTMDIAGDLDVLDKEGEGPSIMTIEDGTLDVGGQLRVLRSTVIVKAGLLDTNTVDSDLSTLAIQGGTFKVAGAFASGDDTITLSGGELELNGAYTGSFTVFTITGGTLDVNEDFSNTGSVVTKSSFKNATITVAANKTATFE